MEKKKKKNHNKTQPGPVFQTFCRVFPPTAQSSDPFHPSKLCSISIVYGILGFSPPTLFLPSRFQKPSRGEEEWESVLVLPITTPVSKCGYVFVLAPHQPKDNRNKRNKLNSWSFYTVNFYGLEFPTLSSLLCLSFQQTAVPCSCSLWRPELM